jgi:Aspartyl/Asparaginyl beta-hydroxylase
MFHRSLLFFLFQLLASMSNGLLMQRQLLSQRRTPRSPLNMAAISPRKALFFEIVESGLSDRFSESEIPRVIKFCEYAKGEIAAPKPLAPLHEPCEEFIDGLTARPWWNTDVFDWVGKLESKSPIIAEELRGVLGAQEVFKGDSRYMGLMGAGWTAFRLQRLGEWNEANTKIFPKTTEIVRSLDIPLAVRGVMFAKQLPKSGVQAHSDGRNFILTAHLGLSVPPQGCWMSVAGEKRQWAQDKVIILDTSFTHETGNESDQDRYVLIIDFWHPELSQAERKALEFIYDARNKFESDRADEIDCSYVRSGRPTDVDAYVRSKKSVVDSVNGFFNLFR